MKPVLRHLLALLLVLIASPVAAHPLHGAGAGLMSGFGHPFAGLDHLLAMLAVGAWAAHIGGQAIWKVPLVFIGALLLGGALGIAGFSLPHVEPMVAASVLALGLLLASGRILGPFPAALLTIFFGLFHGLAHGAEWAVAGSVVAYGLGFLLATGALHAAGAAAALWARHWIRLAGAPIVLCGCWLIARLAV